MAKHEENRKGDKGHLHGPLYTPQGKSLGGDEVNNGVGIKRPSDPLKLIQVKTKGK